VKRRTRIILIVLAVVVAAVVIVGIVVVRTIESNLEKLMDLPLADVDLFDIEDGTYLGSYSVFPVSAEVEVSIKNHEITEIILVKHSHGQGEPAEVIPDEVVKAQTLEVDTISGATYSSIVILKAIENAIKSSE